VQPRSPNPAAERRDTLEVVDNLDRDSHRVVERRPDQLAVLQLLKAARQVRANLSDELDRVRSLRLDGLRHTSKRSGVSGGTCGAVRRVQYLTNIRSPPAFEVHVQDEELADLGRHTQTVNSANCGYYRKAERARTAGEQVHVPVGVAPTTQPIERAARAWAERFFPDIRRWVDLGRGGHFVGMEEPALLAAAIREFIRPLRN